MDEICIIGPVSKDTIWHGGRLVQSAPGGVPTYGGITAARLGTPTKLITKWRPEDESLFKPLTTLAGLEVVNTETTHTTTFELRYKDAKAFYRDLNLSQCAARFTTKELEGIKAGLIYLAPLMNTDLSLEVFEQTAKLAPLALDVQGCLRMSTNAQVQYCDWPDKRTLLPLMTYLKASEEEAQILTGMRDVAEAARQLSAWGASEVIITQDRFGAFIYDGRAYYDIPAFAPPQMVDATGCGDTFFAAYLSFRRVSDDLFAAGRFAAATASLKLAHWGPSQSSWADVKYFMTKAQTL